MTERTNLSFPFLKISYANGTCSGIARGSRPTVYSMPYTFKPHTISNGSKNKEASKLKVNSNDPSLDSIETYR